MTHVLSEWSKDLLNGINMTFRNNRRGRGPNRGGGRRAALTVVHQQNRRDNGHKIKPEMMCPSFATHPWNPFTYSVTFEGTPDARVITTAQIVTYLRGKLGLESTAELPIKLEKARVWCVSKGSGFGYPILLAQFYELQASGSTSLQNARMDIRDHGTLNMPAKAGYLWPLQDRKEVISDSQDLTVMEFSGIEGTSCTVMINFLYRSFGAASGRSQQARASETD